MPIRVTNQNSDFLEYICPMCLYPAQLPTSEYDCQISEDKLLTVTRKNPGKKENPRRINLTEVQGHGKNCDYTLVNAPIEIVEPSKEETPDSSHDEPAEEE